MISTKDYSNQVINGQVCIWLQSFGWAPAKPAKEFAVGELMLWNFGITSEVLEIKDTSKQFLTFTVKCRDGKNYTQRMKKDRLVAVK